MIICDRAYLLAQLRASEAAHARLLAAATKVFGAERAKEVLARVAERARRRLRQENPELDL